jgi:hypothetical protein
METYKNRPCGGPIPEYPYSIPSLLGGAFGLSVVMKTGHNRRTSFAENARVPAGIIWKLMAIVGIAASVPGVAFAIVSLPSHIDLQGRTHCRESGPVQTLLTIHNSQAQYQATKQRFGSLNELNETGYIDALIANGFPIDGYRYSTSDVTAETYCAHADRADDKCGRRDFIVCEDGVIHFVESQTKGAVKRGEGLAFKIH